MKLIISINIETEDEDVGITEAKEVLNKIKDNIPSDSQVSLTREGDRSGKNILLPRLKGRMGNHLQSRKAKLEEIV